MKKMMIFTIALTLSGAAFASDFENLKSQNFTALNTQMTNEANVIMQKINSVAKKSKQPKYFLYLDKNNSFVCADITGKEGYNKISGDELIANPQIGECANMGAVDLNSFILRGVNFRGAILNGAEMFGADLRAAEMTGSHLRGAYMKNAYLKGANLTEADLSAAYLENASLEWANLSKASLHAANLYNADLRGAHLSETVLAGTDLRKAKYNDDTTLPFDDAEAKKRGMIKIK